MERLCPHPNGVQKLTNVLKVRYGIYEQFRVLDLRPQSTPSRYHEDESIRWSRHYPFFYLVVSLESWTLKGRVTCTYRNPSTTLCGRELIFQFPTWLHVDYSTGRHWTKLSWFGSYPQYDFYHLRVYKPLFFNRSIKGWKDVSFSFQIV